MFKHILVALDGSEHSRRAVPSAIEVARRFGSDIFVLHVCEHDRGHTVVYSVETSAEATRLVGDAVEIIERAGIQARGAVNDVAAGHIAKNIVETAGQVGADLIVMGSRGLSDVQGMLLGSVTHKTIQISPTAVLVARGAVPVDDPVELRLMVTEFATA